MLRKSTICTKRGSCSFNQLLVEPSTSLFLTTSAHFSPAILLTLPSSYTPQTPNPTSHCSLYLCCLPLQPSPSSSVEVRDRSMHTGSRQRKRAPMQASLPVSPPALTVRSDDQASLAGGRTSPQERVTGPVWTNQHV